jgi:hypothetical protein
VRSVDQVYELVEIVDSVDSDLEIESFLPGRSEFDSSRVSILRWSNGKYSKDDSFAMLQKMTSRFPWLKH